LTSVQQPLDLEGTTAAQILIERIEGKPRTGRSSHVLLPPKLVVRTSCGAKISTSASASMPVAAAMAP
jgi:DNA-binding LacI/PurR family transcriptional regulator